MEPQSVTTEQGKSMLLKGLITLGVAMGATKAIFVIIGGFG
jgi:hypothetical protein